MLYRVPNFTFALAVAIALCPALLCDADKVDARSTVQTGTVELADLVTELKQLFPTTVRETIVVMDLEPAFGNGTPLDSWFADRISSALSETPVDDRVVNRPELQAALTRVNVNRTDEWNPTKALTIARALYANIVILGSYGGAENGIGVTLTAYRVPESSEETSSLVKIGNASGKLALTSELLARLGEPLATLRPTDGIYRPGVGGVTMPICITCPQPLLRAPDVDIPALLKAHPLGAAIRVQFVVSSDGSTRDFVVVQRVGYGYDEAFVDAMRTWKFRPSVDSDGKSVPVRFPFYLAFKFK